MEIKRWRHISEVYSQTLDYMEKRRSGLLASIKTPWDKMNDAGMDGLEWGNIVIIGGSPGSGKTLLSSIITRSSFGLNPNQKFRVLDYQFEMLGRTMGQRNISSHLKLTMKQLNSADKTRRLTDDDMIAARRYCEQASKDNIFIVDKPLTVDQFVKTNQDFYDEYKEPFIVSLDHSILLKRGATEKDTIESLYNFGAAMTYQKRTLPVIFLVLSQLNRNIEQFERMKPGTYGNYPVQSDLFGAEALRQHADMVLILSKPAMLNLNLYGSERFIINDPDLIAWHFLKMRNGETLLAWFKTNFKHMSFEECVPPPRQK